MDKTRQDTILFTSLSIEGFQTVIIDCVNSCLKNNNRLEHLPPESDLWFNLIELCEYLPDKPTKATVYSWVNSGFIPVHKSSKKLRFLKSEIDFWLLQGRKKTISEIEAEANSFTSKRNRP